MLGHRNRLDHSSFRKAGESRGARIGDGAIFLAGCGVGVASMYLLDPGRGARRRAYLRDKFVHAGRAVADHADKQSRNLANHVKGAVCEMRAKFRNEQVPDDVLIERVRAQLGHAVSHPGALVIRAEDGCVIVTGPVLRGERKKMEDRLRDTRGVCDFVLEVMEHEGREGIPGVQGGSRWERQPRAL
jgi:hyperosmotically inducible periplasmic protein